MLIAAALAVVCMSRQDAPVVAKKTPGAIVSSMFAHYADAKTMVGKIRMTLAARAKLDIEDNDNFAIDANCETATLDTELQFEQPSKIYLRQVQNTANPKYWLVTSDGKRFTYNRPNDDENPIRLMEPVMPRKDVVLTYRDIYAAAVKSIGDRSVPLDIAIGRNEDLAHFRNQLATISDKGVKTIDGKEVHVLGGQWRNSLEEPIAGYYEMYITADGDLIRYSLLQFLTPTVGGGMARVLQVWDVSLTVNGTVDSKLFTVKY